MYRNEYRKDDDTVKPKLFLPYKYVDLSVTRHRDCSEDEIWQFGRDVAKVRKRDLYGRSDIVTHACNVEPLMVVEDPILDHPRLPDNPNHANITGFPAKKEDQMSFATKLAAAASKRIEPK